MNQEQAEPEKIVKLLNERISIEDSITLSEIFIRFGNRKIKPLVGLLVLTAAIAVVSAVAGYYLPLWAGITIGVVPSAGACYWSSRRVLVEVHRTTSR
jgi:hypothetical protein